MPHTPLRSAIEPKGGILDAVSVPAALEQELGWSPIRRLDEFERRSKQTADETFRLSFADESMVLPIWVVPIQLPRYRLENGRTTSAQLEWLSKNSGATANFFRDDPESIEAQYVQHTILKQMVDSTDLRKLFKDGQIKQDDPVILDHNGFVVNGNRRLCLWRDMYVSDKTKFGHFAHIRIIVLPERSPVAISKLEAKLQVTKDVRADYTWHALAHMFKHHRDVEKMSEKDIGAIYEKSETVVKEYLAMLGAAERFLISRGKNAEWSSVTGDEFAFRKIINSLDKVKSATDKVLFQAAAFNLVDHPKKEGRLYERVPDIQKHLPTIKAELAKRFPVQSSEGAHALLGGVAPDISIPLGKKIEEPGNREDATKIVLATIQDQDAIEEAKKATDAFVRLLSRANSDLRSAEMAFNKKQANTGAASQLAEIEAALARIRKLL